LRDVMLQYVRNPCSRYVGVTSKRRPARARVNELDQRVFRQRWCSAKNSGKVDAYEERRRGW